MFFWYSKNMMLRIFAWKAEDQDFTRETWRRYLSEDRLQKASRMKAGKARHLFLGAEILLNQSLERIGAQTAVPAAYTRNPHGKPYLCGKEGLYVNWSHSGDCVLCGLSDREIGVDLQRMEKEPGAGLIRKALQPEELVLYERTEETQRKSLFYAYWTVKESFLKAKGTGFAASLDTFYVNLEGPCPEVVPRDKKEPYTCRILEGIEDYAAAVCIQGAAEGLKEHPLIEWTGL